MHLRHGLPHRFQGWALVRARTAHIQQRHYMRIIHYTLTVFDAVDEGTDLVILEDFFVGAQVYGSKSRCEIII